LDTWFPSPAIRNGTAPKAPEPAAPTRPATTTTRGATSKPDEPEEEERLLAARLKRIGNADLDGRARRETQPLRGAQTTPAATAATAPATQKVIQAPRNEVLIITIRRRPPDNPLNPGRNTMGQ